MQSARVLASGGDVQMMTRFDLESVDGLVLEAALHMPSRDSLGTLVLAHGITVDMDEGGGMFVQLAERLTERGFAVVRFSFRGHGNSAGTQRGMTIAGEMLDVQAVVERALGIGPAPLSIVAASFGAVPVTLSLPYLDQLYRLVLWNPVLDLRHTFLEPELPWGRANFGQDQQADLARRGFLVVDGDFELGRVLYEEFGHYRPADCFVADRRPALVVHGDQDGYVSYFIAEQAAYARHDCEFHTVHGSGHGFDSAAHENEAIAVTVEWLVRHHAAQ
jgi:pimeloyl-ACP methyl ester carboxylesterase